MKYVRRSVVQLVALALTYGVCQEAPPQGQDALVLQHLALLQESHSQLASAFDSSLAFLGKLITWGLGSLAFVFGGSLIGGMVAYRNVLRAATKDVEEKVKAEVSNRIVQSVEQRINILEDLLEREQVVSRTQLEYCRPESDSQPEEYFLIEEQGYAKTRYCNQLVAVRPTNDVLVLDLWELVGDEERIEDALNSALPALSDSAVLVIYYPGGHRSEAISNLARASVYYNVANLPVRLVGACDEAAHTSNTLKKKLREYTRTP